MINRSRSSGDGRRRYVHLVRSSLPGLHQGRRVVPGGALFVCTRNSARSQLAAALWRSLTDAPAESAGTTQPTGSIPVRSRRQAGAGHDGRHSSTIDRRAGPLPSLVITVCDQAHEELDPPDDWLHWSIPDPVPAGTANGLRRHRRRTAEPDRRAARPHPGRRVTDRTDRPLADDVETGSGVLHLDLTRRLVAEALGTGFLIIAVIGSRGR